MAEYKGALYAITDRWTKKRSRIAGPRKGRTRRWLRWAGTSPLELRTVPIIPCRMFRSSVGSPRIRRVKPCC